MNQTHDREGRSVIESMRAQIAATPMPTARRPALSVALTKTHGRPHVVVGVIAGVAAATAVAIVLAFAGATTPPAFAVTTHPNGTITITLRQFKRIRALNAKLTAMGTRIRAVPVVSGCRAPVRIVGSAAPPATLEARPLIGVNAKGHRLRVGPLVSVTVARGTLPGHTLVMAASHSGLYVLGQTVQGPAPSCVGLAAGP